MPRGQEQTSIRSGIIRVFPPFVGYCPALRYFPALLGMRDEMLALASAAAHSKLANCSELITSSHSALVFLFVVGGLIRGGFLHWRREPNGPADGRGSRVPRQIPHEASLPGHLGFCSPLTGDPAPLPRFELLRRSRTVSNKL